jgi:predicted alpha-1,6-mannanase (GH76 family)
MSRQLELLLGPAAGFRETWDYQVNVDGGDKGPQSLTGTCKSELRARARDGLKELQAYYDQTSGLYNGNEWWRGANMLEVAIDFSRELGDAKYLDTIDNTFEKNKSGNFINEYYDDEGWWALAWVRAYDLTHDAKYLSMAKVIFEDIKASWDPSHCGGGVYWKKDTDAKTSISNELFIVLAARLHLRTPGDAGPGSYLDWAQRSWNWFEASGLIGENHQVIDGLDFDTCGPGWDAAFTYNQGVILGALVDLWRATGDASLLETATKIADATLELQTNADGVLIEAECDPKCGGGDGTTFKGVFARNVAYLYEATALPRYRDFLLRQGDAIWEKNRNGMNQLGLNWQGPFDQADAARQAAALDAVLGAVRAADMNLALAASAQASASCGATEDAARAVDGNARSKWCAPGAGGQTLSIDLGESRNVTGFVVRHASSQGEDAAWNTSAFEIAVSNDATNWLEVAKVTGNTEAITTHYVPQVAAKHVRLHVTQAESTPTGGAARIFELEVLGIDRAAP